MTIPNYIINFNKIFEENVIALSSFLKIPTLDNINNIKNNDVIIVFCSHIYPDKLDNIQKIKKNIKYLIIHTEQLKHKCFQNKFYLNLLTNKNNDVYCWSPYISSYLKRKYSINCIDYEFIFLNPIMCLENRFLKYGEKDCYDFIPIENRKIDLFFTGSKNDKREKILQDIKNKYPSFKCIFDFNYSFTDNKKLTCVLLNTKYVINIPFYENSSLELHRINKALSCGCQIISEYSYDDDLNEKYKSLIHFGNIFKTLDKLYKKTLINKNIFKEQNKKYVSIYKND